MNAGVFFLQQRAARFQNENGENVEDVEVIENFENVEHSENIYTFQNVENVQSAETIEQTEQIEEIENLDEPWLIVGCPVWAFQDHVLNSVQVRMKETQRSWSCSAKRASSTSPVSSTN